MYGSSKLVNVVLVQTAPLYAAGSFTLVDAFKCASVIGGGAVPVPGPM